MSAKLIKRICILYFGFFIKSIEASEVIQLNDEPLPLPEKFTLVYDHYHDDNKLYCKFGTKDQLHKSAGFVSEACLGEYKNLTHITPNGTAAWPYLRHQSRYGYILKCESELANGRLESCDTSPYYVGTKCKRNCNEGYVAPGDSVTCRLMEPMNNVTAKWWPPCLSRQLLKCEAGIQNGKLLSCDKEHHFEGTKCSYSCINGYQANSIELMCMKGKSMKKADWLPVDPCQMIEPFKAQVAEPTTFTWKIATGAASALLFVVLVIALALWVYKKFKKRSGQENVYGFKRTEVGYPELRNSYLGNQDSLVSELMLNKPLDDEAELKSHEINTMEPNTSLIQENEQENDPNDNLDLSTGSIMSLSSKQIDFESYEANIRSGRQEGNNLRGNNKQDQCQQSVNFLSNNQSSMYRAKLRGELEVIEGRQVAETLSGLVRAQWKDLGFASENEVKVHEETYKLRTDEKVSDFFLQILSHYDYKIGDMLDYFQEVGAQNVVSIILEVHTNCPYCDQFKMKHGRGKQK